MSGPIKIHIYPHGWDLMGGPWLAVPLKDLTISGKVIACLDCGSVVVPDLMDVHKRRHDRERAARE
jgi:hypothetical protein